jgi:hypothetical protein
VREPDTTVPSVSRRDRSSSTHTMENNDDRGLSRHRIQLFHEAPAEEVRAKEFSGFSFFISD